MRAPVSWCLNDACSLAGQPQRTDARYCPRCGLPLANRAWPLSWVLLTCLSVSSLLTIGLSLVFILGG